MSTHCSVCGRELTDHESTRLGIGPECRTKKGYPMGKAVEVRLPDVVIEAVNGTRLPATAHTILQREGATLAYTTRGLREVLDRLQVEAAVYEASQRLDAVRGEVSTVEDARKVLTRVSGENESLQQEIADLRAKLAAVTAAPAMAVSGAGTGR